MVLVDEDVGWLDVAVHEAVRVQVLQALRRTREVLHQPVRMDGEVWERGGRGANVEDGSLQVTDA